MDATPVRKSFSQSFLFKDCKEVVFRLWKRNVLQKLRVYWLVHNWQCPSGRIWSFGIWDLAGERRSSNIVKARPRPEPSLSPETPSNPSSQSKTHWSILLHTPAVATPPHPAHFLCSRVSWQDGSHLCGPQMVWSQEQVWTPSYSSDSDCEIHTISWETPLLPDNTLEGDSCSQLTSLASASKTSVFFYAVSFVGKEVWKAKKYSTPPLTPSVCKGGDQSRHTPTDLLCL